MKNRFLLIFFLFCFVSCQDDKIGQENNEPKSPDLTGANDQNFIQGEVRIRLKKEVVDKLSPTAVNGIVQTGISPIDRLAHELGASGMERVFPDAGKFEARSRKAGLHLWYTVYFNETIPVTRATRDFAQIPEIDFVEPIRKISIQHGEAINISLDEIKAAANENAPFNDPILAAQWHYNNNGSLPNSKAGADINLFKAWKITCGSPEVIVAVVDGGIDFNHKDLKNNMWINTAEDNGGFNTDDDQNGYKDDIYGWNFVDNSGAIVPHPHGTHVAGTISAENNNNEGVCGIAGGSGQQDGVRLMSCQIFKTNPADPNKDLGTNRLPAAIKYGADNGAVISQNSWGFVFEPGETPRMDASTKAAIDYFIEYAGTDENGDQIGPMKGGVVIFAAGNEDRDYMAYPSPYEKVIAVASMAPDFAKAYYSNYGDWVDITAPGGSFRYGGKYNDKCPVCSTLPNDGYGYMQGTSMACPHVSGVAALIVSKYGVGHPGFTPDVLRARLLNNTKDIDSYNVIYQGKLGHGYMDAAAALTEDQGVTPDPVSDLQIIWGSTTASLGWSVTRDEDNGTPDRYDILWSTKPLQDIDYENLSSDIQKASVSVERRLPGDKLNYVITGLKPVTTYYIAISCVDIFGNRSSNTIDNGSTPNNQAPVVTRDISGDVILKAYETKSVTYDVNDPEGETWTYTITNSSHVVSSTIQNGKIIVTIEAQKTTAGQYEETLTVTDKSGMSSVVKLPFTIQANRVPEVIAALPDMYVEKIGGNSSINLRQFFQDQDGEALTYEVTSFVPGIVSSNVTGDELVLTLLKAGKTEITIKAIDLLHTSCSSHFLLTARDGSQEIDLYPNPVVNTLNIRMGQDVNGPAHIKLYNSAGSLVLESDIVIKPFIPSSLDLSKLSGGSYVISVNYNGKEIKRNIIKL